MRTRAMILSTSSLFLLAASLISAHGHSHDKLAALHKRYHESHQHKHRDIVIETELEVTETQNLTLTWDIQKRTGQCVFPCDVGLVSVTPHESNAGWAMSPDQPCKPGMYCPYACPPGEVMMQWDPSATSYSYPKSMNGGLYCDSNGKISKPFPNKPYCAKTPTNIGVKNSCSQHVAFCQTVLPGNEAMLIPTGVDGTCSATLAVPGLEYWCGTAAHYYINPPGVPVHEACVWGTNKSPVGNWSPYVAGANLDSSGTTFIKLGWNPIYLETTTPFRNEMPNWGVKIDCPNGGCNGLPCAIDPAQNSVNGMIGGSSIGAGGGAFCVVTVAKGSTANFVVFDNTASQTSSSAKNTTTSQTTSSTTTTQTTSTSTSTYKSTSTTSKSYSASKLYSTAPSSFSSTYTKSYSQTMTTTKSYKGAQFYDAYSSTIVPMNKVLATASRLSRSAQMEESSPTGTIPSGPGENVLKAATTSTARPSIATATGAGCKSVISSGSLLFSIAFGVFALL